MADFLTFANLVDECERGLKQYGGAKGDLIKNAINMVYLNEMLTVDNLYPLYWLVDFDDTLTSKAPSVITGITAADPGVLTTKAVHGLVAGDITSIYTIAGMTELNNRMVRINSAPSTTTLTLIDIDGLDAIDTSAYTTYVSDGVINHRGIPLATTGKDVQRILSCNWHDEESMTRINEDKLEKDTQWWDDSTELPSRYYHRKKYTTAGVESNHLLWFHGADAAYDLRYWFELRPPRLVEDTDVPLLPPQFHRTIISGVVMRFAEQAVQVENPVIWPSVYAEELEQLKQFNRKQHRKHNHYLQA